MSESYQISLVILSVLGAILLFYFIYRYKMKKDDAGKNLKSKKKSTTNENNNWVDNDAIYLEIPPDHFDSRSSHTR